MLLGATERAQFLSRHPRWSLEAETLVATFEFPSFPEAISFVQRVAEIAERHEHHPDIDVRFRKVTLRLSTHDAGGLTFRDPQVAAECEAAAALIPGR